MALLCCVSMPLLGHAAGSLGRMTAHSLHLAAAGLWLGTLACLFSLLPTLRRLAPAAPPRLIAGFAVIALPASALLVLTGSLASFQYLHALSQLWDNPYGRTLTLKLALVGGIALCGFVNWQRSRRGVPPHLGIIALELGGACLAVLVTAFLTETEHP
jgi:copper transport protein